MTSERETSATFWDALADVYDDVFPATLHHHREAELALGEGLAATVAEAGPELWALDLGCGTGWASATLRRSRPGRSLRLVLVDSSPQMVARARGALPAGAVADAFVAPLESAALWAALPRDRFDLVLATFSVHHVPPRDVPALFEAVSGSLREGGYVFLLDAVDGGALGKELVRRVEAGLEDERFHAAVARGDQALKALPESMRRHRDYPQRVSELLVALEAAGFEATCTWRRYDLALIVARRRPRAQVEAAEAAPAPLPARAGVLPSVLEAVGWTPLIALDRLHRGHPGRILLKLEYLNPGGSKKDRAALAIVRHARRAGALAPGQPVVELTSGNFGAGLAIACAILGHPFVAVMSAGNSPERAAMMRGLGAEIVLVPQAPGSRPGQVSGADLALVEQRTEQLVVERGAFRADQFRLAANALAHEYGTGAEILRQSGGELTAFVDFVGSGGTFAGVACCLKAARPDIACYVVEPADAAFLAGRPVTRPGHRLQGGGYARALELFDPALCDGFIEVSDQEAIEYARALARTEGVFAGFSTGANLAAAARLLRQAGGGTVACLASDSGLKYLSTDLYRENEPPA
ncbi:MAG TPA: pyridoxal-phosphate dependent enzyme [Polyangiaceae bacterium]|nr:pyridoxal-phosphate dependent enzyme [Polyangiaceae bacterium]